MIFIIKFNAINSPTILTLHVFLSFLHRFFKCTKRSEHWTFGEIRSEKINKIKVQFEFEWHRIKGEKALRKCAPNIQRVIGWGDGRRRRINSKWISHHCCVAINIKFIYAELDQRSYSLYAERRRICEENFKAKLTINEKEARDGNGEGENVRLRLCNINVEI